MIRKSVIRLLCSLPETTASKFTLTEHGGYDPRALLNELAMLLKAEPVTVEVLKFSAKLLNALWSENHRAFHGDSNLICAYAEVLGKYFALLDPILNRLATSEDICHFNILDFAEIFKLLRSLKDQPMFSFLLANFNVLLVEALQADSYAIPQLFKEMPEVFLEPCIMQLVVDDLMQAVPTENDDGDKNLWEQLDRIKCRYQRYSWFVGEVMGYKGGAYLEKELLAFGGEEKYQQAEQLLMSAASSEEYIKKNNNELMNDLNLWLTRTGMMHRAKPILDQLQVALVGYEFYYAALALEAAVPPIILDQFDVRAYRHVKNCWDLKATLNAKLKNALEGTILQHLPDSEIEEGFKKFYYMIYEMRLKSAKAIENQFIATEPREQSHHFSNHMSNIDHRMFERIYQVQTEADEEVNRSLRPNFDWNLCCQTALQFTLSCFKALDEASTPVKLGEMENVVLGVLSNPANYNLEHKRSAFLQWQDSISKLLYYGKQMYLQLSHLNGSQKSIAVEVMSNSGWGAFAHGKLGRLNGASELAELPNLELSTSALQSSLR